MCTAISYLCGDHYFGRTLDYEKSYGEEVVVTPRGFLQGQYALLGIATVREGIPLYYDAINEKGLSMAGLLFAGNACYFPPRAGAKNIPSFALIASLLGECANLSEARRWLEDCVITDQPFSADLPPSPLHWMVADRSGALVVESTAAGLKVYENPIGVLANNPPFDQQLTRLADYQHLSPENPAPSMGLPLYSRGLGAVGLPGDYSSPSRFARAAFARQNLRPAQKETERVGQFFHLMGAVEVPKGCLRVEGADAYTLYTSCANTDRGIYYYTTYENRRISAVMLMGKESGTTLRRYSLGRKQDMGCIL